MLCCINKMKALPCRSYFSTRNVSHTMCYYFCLFIFLFFCCFIGKSSVKRIIRQVFLAKAIWASVFVLKCFCNSIPLSYVSCLQMHVVVVTCNGRCISAYFSQSTSGIIGCVYSKELVKTKCRNILARVVILTVT